jgi:hypothetical protein
MFCHITENWRGRPLTTREVVINLIGNTTTKKELKIQATLDENKYQKGIKVSDELGGESTYVCGKVKESVIAGGLKSPTNYYSSFFQLLSFFIF